MRSERPAWRVIAVLAALAAACAGTEDPADPAPVVAAIEPACGDSSAATQVAIRGTLPVKVEVSVSDPDRNELDTRYRAWVGTVELTDVTWTSASELRAMVPPGLAAGVYGVTVEGPSGKRGTRGALFEVRAGACPVQTASLTIVNPLAAPATTAVGQAVTVTATVQNNGLAAAVGVAASIVSAPAGLTLVGAPPGPQDIPSGQARNYSWTYASSASGGGVFVLEATGTAADTGQPVTARRVNTNDILVNPGAFLTANTSVLPAPNATVGQLITVVLTATNHATAAAVVTPDIVVTGPVTRGSGPAPLSIPAGSARSFQWNFTANAPGTASFTASVSGIDPGSGSPVTVPTAEAIVTVQTAPALSATLSMPPSIELGDFTVTMLVSNSGGASAATVIDVLPDVPTPQAGSTAVVALKPGQTTSPASVTPSQPATFTWVFTATVPGSLTLTSTARGTDANTRMPVASPAASSNTASVGLHTVGGTVTGLAGTGLVLRNGAESLTIQPGATSYVFLTQVPTGGTYSVTVTAQPTGPSQTCTVANGAGTVTAGNVIDVNVTCSTNPFTLGGTVSGLDGHGLVLQNGADTVTIPAGATSYVFQTLLASGTPYAVTVLSQPTGPSQTCTVANGSGVVGAANVTNVNVTCSRRAFTVGGTVFGLVANSGLQLHNGSDTVSVAISGAFTFPTPVASGGAYAVTVAAQPTNPPQLCTITNGSGTVGNADVTNVFVACERRFTIGGSVTGLSGQGLTLLRSGGETVSIAAGAASYAFATPVASGTSYVVTVSARPDGPSQTCTVENGSGVVNGANVTDVNVTCTTDTFTVGGTIGGLVGAGLLLRNGSAVLPIEAGAASFAFPPQESGSGYAVTVDAQPVGQTCDVQNGTGTVGSANVTTVTVGCAP